MVLKPWTSQYACGGAPGGTTAKVTPSAQPLLMASAASAAAATGSEAAVLITTRVVTGGAVAGRTHGRPVIFYLRCGWYPTPFDTLGWASSDVCLLRT